MGRIPLLLPLNVKPSDSPGQESESTPRLQTANSRRASYAYGATDNGSLSAVQRPRESRPSAASGTDSLLGADRVARHDANSLSSRDPRPSGLSPVPSLASVPSMGLSSPVILSSDGSTINRAVTLSRLRSMSSSIGPPSGNLTFPRDGNVHGDSAPLPTAIGSSIRPAPTSNAISAAWVASLPADVGSASPVAPAAGPSANSQSLSGMSLAQFALSSCFTAEQQLRELLEERASPGPGSLGNASPAVSAQLRTASSVPVPPPLAGDAAATHMPAPSMQLPFRRAPAASAMVAGSSGAASFTSQLLLPRRSNSVMLRIEPNRLAVSASSSPVTSPIPHFGAPSAGVSAPGAACVSGGGLLAALMEHRQSLAGAGRPERVTRFAASHDFGNGGNGVLSGGGDGGQHEGVHSGVVEAGPGADRESPRPPHAAALVQQLREDAAKQQQLQSEQQPGKAKRAGIMWASLHPATNRTTTDGDPHHQDKQSSGALSGASPAAAAAAMRAVAELKNMDEFSLVVAARQRQQQLAQLTKQPTLRKLSSMASARGIHLQQRGAGGVDGEKHGHQGDGHGQHHHYHGSQDDSDSAGGQQQSPGLPALLGAGRSSCPGMRSSLDAAPLVSTMSSAFRSGGGSGSTEAAAGAEGSTSSSEASLPHAPAGAAVAGGATAAGEHSGDHFLPALAPSPRPPVVTVSARSLTSSSGNASAALASRSSGSAPSGLTGPHPLAAESAAPGGAGLAGEAGRTAADAEAAVAVRALEARFGSAVLPDSHSLDQDEHDPTVLERRKKLYEALQAANPAAYHLEAAEAAEAAYRALSERAQMKLKRLMQEPTTQEAPLRQLEDALRELTSQRPFFLPPVISKPKVERTFVEADAKPQESLWNVDDSIFAQRKKETESHEVCDTDKVKQLQLNLDWKRVISKARFRRMVSKGDLGVKEDGQSLDEELGEVHDELMRHADFIRSVFVYYSMGSSGQGTSSGEVFQMSASAWLAFCNDAGIVGRGCTSMDVQNIFVAVNFEEESETEESAANDDDAMVRFEFMEGLVRVAFAKYINTKRMADASDALGALLEEVVACPSLPPEARVDPNEWRRTRFYSAEVEEVLKEYWDLIQSMFKLYKARDRARYFWPEHWMSFLESNSLLGPATGLLRRDAKLLFAWSQALVTDELRRRQRAVSLTLWDFIEALARLADTISPPDPADIVQYFLEEAREPPEAERLAYEYYRSVGSDEGPLLRRPSAGVLGPSTRPLAGKLRTLMQYLTCTLREAWGGGEMREVASRVMRTAVFLSGGIEMG